jgi:predicted  nucleic acid-binding Zn-ribbon protein
MNDKTKIERLAQLKEVLINLGMARCEQIELNHQVESMNDRINQLNLDQSAAKTKDAIMKVVDKRRHTRERLTEVRVEVQELETEQQKIESELKWGRE